MSVKTVEVRWVAQCNLCLRPLQDGEPVVMGTQVRQEDGEAYLEIDPVHKACEVEAVGDLERADWKELRDRLDPELDRLE